MGLKKYCGNVLTSLPEVVAVGCVATDRVTLTKRGHAASLIRFTIPYVYTRYATGHWCRPAVRSYLRRYYYLSISKVSFYCHNYYKSACTTSNNRTVRQIQSKLAKLQSLLLWYLGRGKKKSVTPGRKWNTLLSWAKTFLETSRRAAYSATMSVMLIIRCVRPISSSAPTLRYELHATLHRIA